MNWFDTSGLTSLAKSALKEAQKTIDKALDIQDDSSEEQDQEAPAPSSTKSSPGSGVTPQKDNSEFFSSWGLTVSAESGQSDPIKQQPVVTESPSKSNTQSIWGSFAGSFFEQPKSDSDTIVRPPRAKSMNVISDYDNQDDLFSKSQLVMSDGAECLNSKKEEVVKNDERRDSTMSNVLSFMSSRNSSDSVEVLSQSLKSTPDSEPASCQSISHSSSAALKLNSESVEILPDSLVSPSSIECLGFDSYASDKNSSSSSASNDIFNKKPTPVGEKTERADTADSVSLVADDDEDTMSYNSISECTAPTVLDTDDKPISPFPKITKLIKGNENTIHLEQPLIPHKMQISENSSNDGSWSDRTLNADNDSITLENLEDPKKETDIEDVLMEKLSDSSSFYNVSADLLRSESSAFVNIEKKQCSTGSSESSQKESSVKERTSPVSSDSRSDLVKIGSDRTSGHTSGDELETTTSSDIEIIPSPNGDSSSGCQNSPGKYGFKQKIDGATSPNLVDLVLGRNLATKIRGHTRELSEASVQSNTSDESQCSENDRLMRRLSEMAEILDARENRLMEVSRNNAELAECNASLKSQMETLMAKHEGGDINMITEDYTQRMSALEKKFQQAIREKDQLRKQLDTLKSDMSRKNSPELETMLKEKDDIIAQLHEEGEKLARQELQHSNIIKKLRVKEKDNEQVIKGLRDKVAEQSAEMDRMKRSMAAKEEIEVNQIEAVYRLTTANKKMEAELVETKSALDDTTQKLESTRTSLDALKRELNEVQRNSSELQRHRAAHAQAQAQAASERAERDAEILRHELRQLRAERAREEQRWLNREEVLRRELAEAREAAEAGTEAEAPAALLQQLAALQRAALERDRAHTAVAASLSAQLAEAETSATKAQERERLAREESTSLGEQLAAAHRDQAAVNSAVRELTQRCQEADLTLTSLREQLDTKSAELVRLRDESEREIASLRARVSEMETQLANERAALDTERKRNAILQEQVSTRGDISPSHSVASDSFSTSFWQTEEGASIIGTSTPGFSAMGMLGMEDSLATLTRRDGERRGLNATLTSLRAERKALTDQVASLQEKLADYQNVQEQYDALLQMYGEKEEQLAELRLDLHDVTQLYKSQLHDLLEFKRQAR